MCVCVCVCACVWLRVCVCVCVCVFVCVCVCVHNTTYKMCVHLYIFIIDSMCISVYDMNGGVSE